VEKNQVNTKRFWCQKIPNFNFRRFLDPIVRFFPTRLVTPFTAQTCRRGKGSESDDLQYAQTLFSDLGQIVLLGSLLSTYENTWYTLI
jgi:hypothetical protein